MSLKARNISFLSYQPHTNICTFRNTEYVNYIYMPIEQLQTLHKAITKEAERCFLLYMEWDRSESYPDPLYNYMSVSEKLIAVNKIIMYKIMCRERFISSSYLNWNHKEIVEKSIYKIVNILNSNPYSSYFELLDAFPEEEIELVIEYLIENNRLHCTEISKGKEKGKNTITIT